MNVIQSKIGIIINDGVSVKNYMIVVLVKRAICGILARGILNVIKHVKLTNI